MIEPYSGTKIEVRNADKGKVMDLSALMAQCACRKGQGGRGSGIRFFHERSGRILAFDEPHPENELYPYQIKLVRQFLREIGEYREDKTNDGV